jgi:long-chain acyl-CoA synthetase
LARRDTDGYVWFEGRKKEIIVRDGVNISPQEVEEAIYNHPAVLEVAVIGIPDPVGAHGERVLAFVSLRDGVVVDEQELRDHTRQLLADFKVPERFVFRTELPKGITGKVHRRTPTAVITGVSTGIGYETARTLAGRGFHVFGSVNNKEKYQAGEWEIIWNSQEG